LEVHNGAIELSRITLRQAQPLRNTTQTMTRDARENCG
jgi:hypothetical protein